MTHKRVQQTCEIMFTGARSYDPGQDQLQKAGMKDQLALEVCFITINKVLSEQVECRALCMCIHKTLRTKLQGSQWVTVVSYFFPVTHTIDDL